MPRAIVYPPSEQDGVAGADGQPNGYGEKLAKYVPAEVLSPFLLLVTAAEQFKNRDPLLIISLIVGIMMTPIYLAIVGHRAKSRQRWYSYVLSVMAFVGWAVGTRSSMAELFHLQPEVGSFILLVIVFAIPGIDELLTWSSSQGRRTDV